MKSLSLVGKVMTTATARMIIHQMSALQLVLVHDIALNLREQDILPVVQQKHY